MNMMSFVAGIRTHTLHFRCLVVSATPATSNNGSRVYLQLIAIQVSGKHVCTHVHACFCVLSCIRSALVAWWSALRQPPPTTRVASVYYIVYTSFSLLFF